MTDRSVYRLDLRHVLRLAGTRLVIAAVLVAVAAVLLGFDGSVRIAGYALGGAAIVLTLAAAVGLVRPPAVVVLDETGYRVRRVRDCGVRAADWTQISRVDHKTSEVGQTLVIALQDERTTHLPLVLLASSSAQLQREVHQRLNHANGYRDLPSALRDGAAGVGTDPGGASARDPAPGTDSAGCDPEAD